MFDAFAWHCSLLTCIIFFIVCCMKNDVVIDISLDNKMFYSLFSVVVSVCAHEYVNAALSICKL